MASSVAGKAIPKMSSAMRKLCQDGVEALKPQLILNSNTRTATHWNPPAIPRRVSNNIRKRAIQEGTYGSFDTTTGRGWDPLWDVELAKSGSGGGTGRYRLRPNKKKTRERTREQRAQKIEKNLEDMDEKIAEYYIEKSQQKPIKNFEFYFKKHNKRR